MNTIIKCPICNRKYIEAQDDACDSCLGLEKGSGIVDFIMFGWKDMLSTKAEFDLIANEQKKVGE